MVLMSVGTGVALLAAVACGGRDSTAPPAVDAAGSGDDASVEATVPLGDSAIPADGSLARDAADAAPARDGSAAGDASQTSDSSDAADASSGESGSVAPALRVVNLVQGVLGNFPLTICVAVHGATGPITPTEYSLSYNSISQYVPLAAGTYDVWAVLLVGCTSDAGTPVLDAGNTLVMPPTPAVIATPTTLAFYRTYDPSAVIAARFVAFTDTGTPSGQADVRMHNVANGSGALDFYAGPLATTPTDLGANISFGATGPMRALSPTDWLLWVTYHGGTQSAAAVDAMLSTGVWDGFAYYASPTSSTPLTLVVCPPVTFAQAACLSSP
jgi:hypothetical protein